MAEESQALEEEAKSGTEAARVSHYRLVCTVYRLFRYKTHVAIWPNYIKGPTRFSMENQMKCDINDGRRLTLPFGGIGYKLLLNVIHP